MGVVYEVYDPKRGERVALKTMNRVDASMLYQFKQEFRALSDVVHPNLVRLHELMSVDDQWFFTMELVFGVDFLAYVTGHVRPHGEGSAPNPLCAPVSKEGAYPTEPTGTLFAASAMSSTTTQDGPTPVVALADLAHAAGGLGAREVGPPTAANTQGLAQSLASQPTVDLSLFTGTPALSNETVTSFAHSRARAAAKPSGSVVAPGPRIVSWDRLRESLRQLAEGLNALHGAGKLHHDIKPSNVMVTGEGRVVVLDFGIASDIDPRDGNDDQDLAGTPAYMSPERMMGLPAGPASDWFSVGVMLYEAIAGYLPHVAQSPNLIQLLAEKRAGCPPALSKFAPDVEPDLEALCLALLRGPPEARPSGHEVLRRLQRHVGGELVTGGAGAAAPPELFVGRWSQLAALQSAFATARAGATVIVYVHGISGMGKSGLVRTFLDGLASTSPVILAGRCYERESMPYKGLDSLIDALSRHLAGLPDKEAQALLPADTAALVRVFPVLGRVAVVEAATRPIAQTPDPQELRRRAVGALREIFARLGQARPLVLHIDDLQWGDLDSASLLGELLRAPEAPSLLLVGSFRSEARESSEVVRALPRLGDADADVREIAVDPLPPDDAWALACALLGPEYASLHAGSVARESGGSPFFIHELARQVVEHRTIPGRTVTLDEVLVGRLDRLSIETRRLLELVAVAGRPIPEPVLRRAAGPGADDQTALATLRAQHLLRVLASGEGDQVETFHDRIREITVAHLSSERLRQDHLALALSLEAAGADADAEAIAGHFAGAGEPQRAITHALAAAEQAARALAFDRAAKLFRLALSLGQLPGAEARALRVELGHALANAGRGAEAADAYLAAAAGAPFELHLDLHRRAAEQLLISGHIDRGLRAMEEVLASVGMRLAATPRRALLSLATRRLDLKLRGLAFEEKREADIPASHLLKTDACWAVARGMGMVDNLRAADFQTRQLLLALRDGEPYRVARGLAMEVAFISGPGEPNRVEAEALSEKARALAARIGHPHAIGLATLTTGMSLYLRGHWRSGLDLCLEAEQILRERCTSVAWELASAHRFALGARMYLGDIAELRRWVHLLLDGALKRGNLYAATDIRTRINLVWLADDAPDEAESQHDEAMSQWSNQGFHLQHYSSLLATCQRLLYTGRGAEAARLVEEKWPLLEGSMLLRIQMVRIEGLHLRARCALGALASGGLASGDRAARLALAAACAKRIEKERMPWADPLAGLLRAALAHEEGDRRATERLLRDAMIGLDREQMALYAAAARHRIAELVPEARTRLLAEESARYFAAEKIRDPARMAAMLAPGLDVRR